MNPPVSYSGNVFSNNLAAGVPENNNITTEIIGSATSPERLIVTNYAEGVRDLQVNISLVDYYQSVVASTSTLVRISVDSSQKSCLFNTDSAGIFGSLTAYTVAGVASI